MNVTFMLKRLSLVILLLVISVVGAHAQMITVEGQLYRFNDEKKKNEPASMQYVVVKSSIAEGLAKTLQKAAESGDNPDKILKSKNYILEATRADGSFTQSVMPGSSFIFIYLGSYFQAVKADDIVKNPDVVFKMSGREIDEVKIIERQKRKKFDFTEEPSIDTGYEIYIPIFARFNKEYVKNSTRMTIQPFLIYCQTEDTVHYLDPLVFDGNLFHEIQHKRMSYDFDANDPIAKYYNDSEIDSVCAFGIMEDSIYVDTTIVYKKSLEEKDKGFKGGYFCVLEDFNHEYYSNNGKETGSCLRIKPFKFLDFSMATIDLPLSEEFEERAESKFETVPRNLKLKFELGKSVLTADSINQVEAVKLSKELRSYGQKLWNVRVEGGASPDGSLAVNERLARQRANVARSLIIEGLGSLARDVVVEVLPPRVYTWEDVAKELDNMNRLEEADTVRFLIDKHENNGSAIFAALKKLESYETSIVPALENLRIMKCSYMYERDHVLTGEEVVDYYYNNPDYTNGTKHFSNGDLFKLFQHITDSAELDKLIPFAYKEATRRPNYHLNPFSPFIAVKMAILCQKRGIVNTEILRPFIDFSDARVNLKYNLNDFGGYWIKNRKEVLANQAIMYFKESALDTAQAILNMLQDDPDVENLRQFVSFQKLFFKPGKTPEEAKIAKDAYNFVISTSLENKAILFTELRTSLGVTVDEASALVDKMDDKDPRKWYLKGMLLADIDVAGNEPVDVPDFKKLSIVEQMELQRKDPDAYFKYLDDEAAYDKLVEDARGDKTPHFLAYFQHSFDLDPTYKMLYFEEGNVADALRKKYRYKRAEIPAYRKKFEFIMNKGKEKTEPTAGETAEGEVKDEMGYEQEQGIDNQTNTGDDSNINGNE